MNNLSSVVSSSNLQIERERGIEIHGEIERGEMERERGWIEKERESGGRESVREGETGVEKERARDRASPVQHGYLPYLARSAEDQSPTQAGRWASVQRLLGNK